LRENPHPWVIVSTASAIIIGDEILAGKYTDENGPWLARECRSIGLDLQRILVIPDNVETIAEAVFAAHSAADHVFTTGGIGPTHDDMTMAGVAHAFGVPLIRDPDLEQMIRARMGERVNDDALRMADVPQGTVLWDEPDLRFPITVCRNVAIFPGVPSFFQAKFRAVSHRFAGVRVQSLQFRTCNRETDIAALLREAQETWPSVSIGSYPRFETSPPSVVVTMDARDPVSLSACANWLRARIPHEEA